MPELLCLASKTVSHTSRCIYRNRMPFLASASNTPAYRMCALYRVLRPRQVGSGVWGRSRAGKEKAAQPRGAAIRSAWLAILGLHPFAGRVRSSPHLPPLPVAILPSGREGTAITTLTGRSSSPNPGSCASRPASLPSRPSWASVRYLRRRSKRARVEDVADILGPELRTVPA